MPISVECSVCFQKYRVRDEFAGKSVKCKGCGSDLRIPAVLQTFLDDEEDDGGAAGSDDWETSFGKSKKRSGRPAPQPLKRTPVRSRAAEEDDEEVGSGRSSRTRPLNKKSAKSSQQKLLIIGVTAFAVIAAVGGGFVFKMLNKGGTPPVPGQQVAGNNPPPGSGGFPGNPPGGNPPPVAAPPAVNPPGGVPPGFPAPPPNNGFPQANAGNQPGLGANPPAANPPQIPKFTPGDTQAKANPPAKPSPSPKPRPPEKKPRAAGFQPVAEGEASSTLENWTVQVDPPAEAITLDGGTKVRVGFPKGAKLEVVHPASPSPFIAVGSNNNEREFREIRDIRTNQKLGTVKGVRVHGTPWALSPDGRYLAGWVLFEKSIRVWDVKSGKALGQLPLENGGFLKILQFAGPDRLLACGHDSVLTLWQIPSGTEERTIQMPNHLRDHQYGVSPGGKYLTILDGDHNRTTLRVYDLTTGKVAGESLITGEHTRAHQCQTLQFSPDGQELALLFDHWDDLIVVTVDVTTGEQTSEFEFKNTIKNVPWARSYKGPPLAWFPNKQRWLINGVGLLDRGTQKIVWTIPGADQEPSHDFPAVSRVLDDSHILVAAGDAKEARIVDFELPEAEVAQAASVVASGGLAVDARLPPLAKSEFGAPPKLSAEPGGAAWGMRADPVGEGGAELLSRALPLSAEENPLRGARLSGPQAARLVVLYGPDKGPARPRVSARRGKKSEAPASADAAASTLEVVDLKERKELESIDLPYNADLLSVTLDGRFAVVRMIDSQGRLDIYQLDDGEHVMGWRPYGHFEKENEQKVKAAVFVDEKHILTLSESDLLALWDLNSMRAVYQVEHAANPGVSPGRRYFSVSHPKGFRLFDALTGEVRGDALLRDGAIATGGAGFHPRGDRLAATVNRNRGTYLVTWDLTSGKLVEEFVIPVGARRMQWCGDDYVLLDDRVLVDVPHKMVVWNYVLPPGKGVHLADSPDGRHWYLTASGGQNSSVTVTAAELPHAAARKQLETAKLDPGYLLRPGSKVSVRFNITQSPPNLQNFQQDVWKNLQAQLAKNELTVVDNERLVIYVMMSHKMTGEKHSFRMSGFGRGGFNRNEIEVAGQVVECGLQVWLDNKVVWNGAVTHGNGAFFIHLKEGVSVEQHLQEQMWNAAAQHLLHLEPPQYVLPDSAAQGLGSSTLNADGPQ